MIGPLAKNQRVTHSCDDINCVNPAHLLVYESGINQNGNFWVKVDRSGGPTACWPWLGAKTSRGYGAFTAGFKGKTYPAHRFAYMLWNEIGELDPKVFACHTCDNRECVNPAHIFLGSHRDNMDDMKAKERNPFGVSHGCAKLSEQDIQDICRLYSDGTTVVKLGRLYGVAPAHISGILRGKSWGHLDRTTKSGTNHARGENAGKAKLNTQQVLAIRAEYRPNTVSYKTLAVKYGVGESTIRAIVQRKTWQHI
jgi:hypothetical protein